MRVGLPLFTLLVVLIVIGRAFSHPPAVRPAHSVRPAAAPAIDSGRPLQPEVPGLAPGACESFGPKGRDLRRTVFIDPGHGGADPGVVSAGSPAVAEKQVALAVALNLSDQLRSAGFRVVLSRTADTSVAQLGDGDVQSGTLRPAAVRKDLMARIACANASQAAALVSIHFNAYSDPAVRGTQTVYDAARPFASENLRLSRNLQTAMVARLLLKDKGVLPDDQLDAPALTENGQSYGRLLLLGPPQPGVLDASTSMPGALVEPLFLSSPAEARLAASQAGQHEIARALAEGLQAFLLGAGAR